MKTNELDPRRLRQLLLDEFSEAEIQTLCQGIGINYDDLPGVGQFGKTRELIVVAQSQHLTGALSERMRQAHPDAFHTTGASAQGKLTSPAAPVEQQASQARPIPRGWLIALIFVALVCVAGAVIAFANPFTAALPAVETPLAAAPAATASPLLSGTASSVSPNVVTSPTTTAPAPTQTMPPTPTATVPSTPTPAPTRTPAPTPTQTPQSTPTTAAISVTDAAASFIFTANAQLLDFYSGRLSANVLRSTWSTETYSMAIGYVSRQMKKKFNLDVAPGAPLVVSMQYLAPPKVVLDEGASKHLTAREYWTYRHPGSGHILCETVDYRYNLALTGSRFMVIGFQGDMVTTAVDNGCQ